MGHCGQTTSHLHAQQLTNLLFRPYGCQVLPLPLNVTLLVRGPAPRLYGFFGQPESISQLEYRSVQAFLQGSWSGSTDRHMHDRPTDMPQRATPSVAIGRIWLLLKCGLKINTKQYLTYIL